METVSTTAPCAHTPDKYALERFAKLVEHNRLAQIDLAMCHDEDEDELDRLSDIAFAAQENILAKPAPDIAALAAKLEIVANDTQFSRELLTGLVADATRLAGIDTVPTFVPEVWLHYFQHQGGRVDLRDGKYLLSVPVEQGIASVYLRELTDWQRTAINDHLNSLDRESEG